MSIVLIDPVSSGTAYIDAARRMNLELYVLCVDEGERKLADSLRKKVKSVIKVDSRNLEALKSEIERIGDVTAVIPGSEYTVPVCAQLGKIFQLPHLGLDTIDFVREKNCFRQKLKANNLSKIKYFTIDRSFDLKTFELPAGFRFPAVVKPIDMSGSTKVRRVDNIGELSEITLGLVKDEITDLDFVSSGKIIVEEYITGNEFSVEGVVTENGIEVVSVTEKILGPEPYFIELGHIVKNRTKNELEQTIRDYAKVVIEKIGLNIGPFHLELRITPSGNPEAIELAARMPGDRIVDLIFESHGVDLAQMAIAAYTKQSVQKKGVSTPISAISFIPKGDKKVFTELTHIEKYTSHKFYNEHKVYLKEGDFIGKAHDWSSRVGYFMFAGDDYDEIKRVVLGVNNEVCVK